MLERRRRHYNFSQTLSKVWKQTFGRNVFIYKPVRKCQQICLPIVNAYVPIECGLKRLFNLFNAPTETPKHFRLKRSSKNSVIQLERSAGERPINLNYHKKCPPAYYIITVTNGSGIALLLSNSCRLDND